MAVPETFEWRRDDYLLSTKRSLVQPKAFNAALGSDVLWWASPLPEDVVETLLNNSLCFGLYKITASNDGASAENSDLEMIGFGRIVTDYATVGYLTDVYILKEHQGKGLGGWMMRCMNELLEAWPHLRRVLLLTSSPEANQLYERTLSAKEWSDTTSGGLYFLQKMGVAGRENPKKKAQ